MKRKEKLEFLAVSLKALECKLLMLKQREANLLREVAGIVEGHQQEIMYEREALLQKEENSKKKVKK